MYLSPVFAFPLLSVMPTPDNQPFCHQVYKLSWVYKIDHKEGESAQAEMYTQWSYSELADWCQCTTFLPGECPL